MIKIMRNGNRFKIVEILDILFSVVFGQLSCPVAHYANEDKKIEMTENDKKR